MSKASQSWSCMARRIRALLVLCLTIIFTLCACGPSDGNYSPLASSELNAATIEVAGPVEYSREPVDIFAYVTCSDEDVALSAGNDLIATKVGTQSIPIEATKGFFSRTEELEFSVQDTKAPTIEFTESSVRIEIGDPFDAESFLASVSDPIDGDLTKRDNEPMTEATQPGLEEFYDEGWYTLKNNVNLMVAGDYEVTVEASDNHGNRVSESLPVTVIDPLEGVTLDPVVNTIEYGPEAIDAGELVVCSDKETTVEANKIIPDTIGKLDATYTMSKHHSSHEVVVSFVVKDTKKPVIKLKQEEVKLEMGDGFDAYTYVESVKDPIDGDLQRTKKQPEAKGSRVGEERFYDKGWFIVNGKADTTKEGSTELTVLACDKHGNEVKKHLKVIVTDPLKNVTLTPTSKTLEYSSKSADATKLVTCSVKGAKVEAKKINLAKVGKKTVKYTVTKGASIHTVEVTFTIKDTKKPKIKLESGEITVDWGADYNPYSNIVSVKDPVDGALARVEKEQSEAGDGWYTITGSYDTSESGTYFLTVVAQDRNGNKKSKEFSLVVGERPQVSESQPVDNGRDYVINTNTGKFHYPSCRDVNRIKESNRWDVHMTRDEVIAMGYESCGHCHP